MATKSSAQPTKSKPTLSNLEGTPTLIAVTTSTTTLQTATMADPVPPPRMRLGELAASFMAESGKRMEAMQKSQVDSRSGSSLMSV